MFEKKAIKAVEVKRTRPLSRLIKCYVCNQHFDEQAKFDIHLKQHQSKLNRTNIDEIQRKTQESFNKRKHISALNKTQSIEVSHSHKDTMEKERQSKGRSVEDVQDQKEEEKIEEALRESQILLEKIEFMTQVVPTQTQTLAEQTKQEDVEYFQKNIEGEKKLYHLISKAENNANIEKLILQTQFEMRYFENYQEQLYHLRVLASVAAKADSIAKIVSIRKSICRDVCEQLEKQFKDNKEEKERKPLKQVSEPTLMQNTGQVRYCADCLSVIGVEEQLYSLSCGHSYHVDCFNGFCCS